jgi:hypothetical protein
MNNFSQAPAQIRMFNGLQVIDMNDLNLKQEVIPSHTECLKKLSKMMGLSN